MRLAVPTDVPTTYRFGGESLARAGTRNREHPLASASECKRRRRPGLTQPRLAASKVCTTSVERAQEVAAESRGLPLGWSVALASVGESPSRGRCRSQVSHAREPTVHSSFGCCDNPTTWTGSSHRFRPAQRSRSDEVSALVSASAGVTF